MSLPSARRVGASVLICTVLLAGCGGGGGGGGTAGGPGGGGGGGGGGGTAPGSIALTGATITTLGLAGSSTAPMTATVNGVADQDGAADLRWRVELTVGSASLPVTRTGDGRVLCSLSVAGGAGTDALDLTITP